MSGDSLGRECCCYPPFLGRTSRNDSGDPLLFLVLNNCDAGKVDARTKPLFLRELNRLGLEGDSAAAHSQGWFEFTEIWVVFPLVPSVWLRGLHGTPSLLRLMIM